MTGILNRDLKRGWQYHDSTKHSYQSVRSGANFLDWPNKPLEFKIYPKLEPIPLPGLAPPSGVAALSAIATHQIEGGKTGRPDLTALTQVLYFSAGITRRRRYAGGEIWFRAAACTGALYQFELYVACGDFPDLPAGLYHFAPADMALRRLRAGDYRGLLAAATAGEPAVAQAPATVICAGTYWRNAWKYRARAYRHFGWDNGTILANMLAEAAALSLPAKVVMGFVDAEVNHLLGLDPAREAAFSIVPLGRAASAVAAAASPPPPSLSDIPALELETVRLSPKEVDYPAMHAMHDASSLGSADEVTAWRGASRRSVLPPPAGRVFPLRLPADGELPRDTLEEVILRRGSSRAFARESITFAQLSAMLDRCTRGIPADFSEESGAQLNDLYVIAHAVEDLTAGAYYLRQEERVLECLKEGDFRSTAGYLALEQELAADCSAAVFFLADLTAIFERFGNRGYRAVQLEAGMLGGKLYLAAYAQRLGATGLTFYDDDVTGFFSPHAQDKSAIFLVALGHRAKP